MNAIRTIGLIACGKTKLDAPAPAGELYTGPLFRMARAYIEATCDEWGILSAKHGLVMPQTVIAPYDQRIPRQKFERLWWRRNINARIRSRWCANAYRNDRPDGHGSHFVDWAPELLDVRFVILAGAEYREVMDPDRDWGCAIPFEAPMAGMQIGEQLSWLKRQLDGLRAKEEAGSGARLPRAGLEGGQDQRVAFPSGKESRRAALRGAPSAPMGARESGKSPRIQTPPSSEAGPSEGAADQSQGQTAPSISIEAGDAILHGMRRSVLHSALGSPGSEETLLPEAV